MTAQETEILLNQIIADLNIAADFIGTLDPALIPLIIIGKAVDKLIPGVAAQIQTWIEGNPPTQQELEDFKAKLATLGNPDLP